MIPTAFRTKKLIVGNWKMYIQTVSDAKKIARRARTLAAPLKHAAVVRRRVARRR